MTVRATFTIDDDLQDFLLKVGGENRSAYINQLLKREKRRMLEEAIQKANKEEAEDIEYQKELVDWDETLADGLPS